MSEQFPSRAKVAFAVTFHISIALTVTLCNKGVLNTLPLPITLLAFQSLMTVIFVHAGSVFNFCSVPKVDVEIIKNLLPLLGIRLVAQFSKIYCLQNVNASFYQIARGLLLPFTIALSAAFLPNSRPGTLALLACGITMCGFVFGVSGEKIGQTSTAGIAWGIWSSLTTAIETIVMKKYVSGLKLGVLDLVYTSALAMAPIFSVMVLLNGEYTHLISKTISDIVLQRFAVQVFVAGIFSFLLSIAAFLQIKTTSPTTHMISTAARGVLQSLLAVVFMSNEHLSSSRILSIAVILTGSVLYTYAKELELRKKAAGGGDTLLPIKEPFASQSEGETLRTSLLDSFQDRTEKGRISG